MAPLGIAFALFAFEALAQSPAFHSWGGNQSCATWQSDASERLAGDWWIWGFWSGRNSGRMAAVGMSTDANGLLAEIKLACEAKPSASLVSATIAVYERMRREGR